MSLHVRGLVLLVAVSLVAAWAAAGGSSTVAASAAAGASLAGEGGPDVTAQAGSCTPLDDAGLVAQVLGAPISTPVMTEAVATMAAEHVGTVVLLGGAIESAEQVRRLTDQIDWWSPLGVPALVAVDEEGGRVARFGRAGVTVHLPSARAQAAGGTVEDVRAGAAALGGQLASLGVDHNLAPVLDLFAGEANGIVGDRSFSADPAAAGAYGGAFAAGMGDAGLTTSAKHFPDHGLSTTDTHTDVAVVEVSLDTLRGMHLEPYRLVLDEVDSVMLSHLRIPDLDPDLPVSLSPAAVAFLRDELARPSDGFPDGRPYDGVVVTDDLSMQAVAAVADQPTAALLAVDAGADLALVGSVEAAGQAHARLLSALGEGALSRHRLVEAAVRVLRLKGLEGRTISCLVGPTHYTRPTTP